MSLPMANVIDARLAGLLRAWREACDVAPEALDALVAAPLQAPALAPYADHLILVVRDGQSFRYDHYGAAFSSRFGMDLSGQVLARQPETVLTAYRRHMLHTEYAYVVGGHRPLWRAHVIETEQGKEVWQRLVLPLGQNKLLAAAYAQPEQPAGPESKDDPAAAYAGLLRMIIGAVPVWLTAAGAVDGLAVNLAEITEAKRREEITAAALRKVENASLAKSLFLATMSHELRTPLNSILGFSELIKSEMAGRVSDRAHIVEYVDDINFSGHHLLDLVNDVLDIAKIESGRLSIMPEWVDVVRVVNSVVRQMSEQASNRSLHLLVDILDPPKLWADEKALRQILFNLLSNALKFTPAEGQVMVACRAVPAGGVELAVSDTGRGIPEDQIDRVLRPFEQLDNRYDRASGGTGLGLTLVKGLAELHRGSMTLVSVVGIGTTVTVFFPEPDPSEIRATVKPDRVA